MGRYYIATYVTTPEEESGYHQGFWGFETGDPDDPYAPTRQGGLRCTTIRRAKAYAKDQVKDEIESLGVSGYIQIVDDESKVHATIEFSGSTCCD